MRFQSAILVLALVSTGANACSQEPKTPDALLAGLGLTAEKTRYIFADAEKALREKYRDATAARDQAREAVAKAKASAMMDEGILELQAGEQQIQSEIAEARASSAGMSYGRNRYARHYRNQVDAVVREEQRAAEQIRKRIEQVKKQKPTPKQQQAAEAAARMAMGRAQQTVKDVNDAYDALVERYEEVRARDDVQKALEDVGRPKKVGFQLGPLEETDKIGKWAKGILKIRPKRATTHAHKPAGATDHAGARPVEKTPAPTTDRP